MNKKLILSTFVLLLLVSLLPSAMAYGYGYDGYAYEKSLISETSDYNSDYFGSSYNTNRVESYEKYEEVSAIFDYNLRRYDDGSRQYRAYDYDDLNSNYFTAHYQYGPGYTKQSSSSKSYEYVSESSSKYESRSNPYFRSGRYRFYEYEPAFSSFRQVYEKEVIKSNEFSDETVRYYY